MSFCHKKAAFFSCWLRLQNAEPSLLGHNSDGIFSLAACCFSWNHKNLANF